MKVSEYSYKEELKKGLIQLEQRLKNNDGEIQNLWKGFDLIWDTIAEKRNRMKQIHFEQKSVDVMNVQERPEKNPFVTPPPPPPPQLDQNNQTHSMISELQERLLFESITESEYENEPLSKKNSELEYDIKETIETNNRLLEEQRKVPEDKEILLRKNYELKDMVYNMSYDNEQLVREKDLILTESGLKIQAVETFSDKF